MEKGKTAVQGGYTAEPGPRPIAPITGSGVAPERKCRHCEYFDKHNGDCHNSYSRRFQTTADETCDRFFPDTSRWARAPQRQKVASAI